MKYRKLRIAFSVTCGIACVLLVVLWVRSCYRLDDLGDWKQHWILSVDGKLLVDGRFTIREESPYLLGGYLHVVPVGAAVTIPYWLLVAVAGTLAALFWIRHWRFSLRTLLIATTLVAAVLGLIVYAAR